MQADARYCAMSACIPSLREATSLSGALEEGDAD